MKKLFTLFVCLGAGAMVWAQTLKVTGTVVDEDNGEPLIGVSVLEMGTTNGIITDLDGNFTITVSESAKLQLSYVGYATLEIKAKKNLGILEMAPEAVALTDVLVTGQLAKQQNADFRKYSTNDAKFNRKLWIKLSMEKSRKMAQHFGWEFSAKINK